VAGCSAYITNGVSHGTSFSTILTTTRNKSLDVLAKGHTLGVVPLDKAIAATTLRFGLLAGADAEVPGFGLDHEVRPMGKGLSGR